jgi:hypothetical protein
MARSAGSGKEGVWNKPDDGTEEEDEAWGPGWPAPLPVSAPHVGESPCPVIPCPYCILGVRHEASLAMVKEQWDMTMHRYHEQGDSWHRIFIQSVAFSWICQRVDLLLQEPDIPWGNVAYLQPNTATHDQTISLVNEHRETPPKSRTSDLHPTLTMPPPPPPPDNLQTARWLAVGSDSSTGSGWRPRTFAEPVWAPPAATPDKVFEYECTGGESKKKKYRAYDDAQQRVLWEAYMRDDDDVEITVDSKYTYSIFFAPRWLQRSHSTGYERAVRLMDC